MGVTFFPDFENQISQKHYFIICQDAQTPYQLFFTNASLNGPTGIQSILGSQIQKSTYCTIQKRQYCHEKLSTRFLTIEPNKSELLFGNWLLFLSTKDFYGQKTKFWKIFFLGLKFFPDFQTQIGQQHFFIICQDA